MVFDDDIILQGIDDERLPLSALTDAKMRAVLTYWETKRGDRTMPTRADIKPEEIAGALGRVNLVEVTANPLRFRFRLVGTQVVQSYGRDVTGMAVDKITPSDYSDILIRHFSDAVTAREPVLHVMHFLEAQQTHMLHRLSLPLSDDGDEVNMVMTVAHFGPELQRLRERQSAADQS